MKTVLLISAVNTVYESMCWHYPHPRIFPTEGCLCSYIHKLFYKQLCGFHA